MTYKGTDLALPNPITEPTTTKYNAYGQVTQQTDDRGNIIDMEYDIWGRVVRKTLQQEGVIHYFYDGYPQFPLQNGYIGKISRVTATWKNGSQIIDEFQYDNLGRETTTIEIVDGKKYIEEKKYDTPANCGKFTTLTYPDGFAIKHKYKNGQLQGQVKYFGININFV